MHYQRAAFRSVLTKVFTKVAYIGFNTRAEEKLAEGIFGPFMSPHGIISVGCEVAPPQIGKQRQINTTFRQNIFYT